MATATKSSSGSNASSNKRSDPSVEDLAAQIETLRTDLAALMKTSQEYGSAKARQFAGQARERADTLRHEGERVAEEAGRFAAQNADAAMEAVRRQPLTAVAIAAGLGFLVGLVVSGRR